MFDSLVQRLKSADPKQRREAIIELVRAGDAAALPVLRNIASSDPVAEMRDLAEKGVQRLQNTPSAQGLILRRTKGWEQESDAANAALSDKRIQARGQLNNAYGAYESGNHTEARFYLLRALEIDEDYKVDPEWRTLFETVTGEPIEAYLVRLKAAQRGKRAPRPEWIGERIPSYKENELPLPVQPIQFILLFALTTITLTFSLFVASIPQYTAFAPWVHNHLGEIGGRVPSAIGAALISIAWFMLIISISFWAGQWLNGMGTYSTFVGAMINVQNVCLVMYIIGFGLFIFVYPLLGIGAQRDLSGVIRGINLLAGLLSIGLQIHNAARVHQFGYGRGCLTVFLPYIFGIGLIIAFVILAATASAR